MQHRQNNEYGENLYCAFSSDSKFKLKGEVAVKSWYDEIKDFKFGREPADLRAGKCLLGAIVSVIGSKCGDILSFYHYGKGDRQT